MNLKFLSKSVLLIGALLNISTFAAPKVITTIKPLHSLTASLMQGIGEPSYIISDGSPHNYRLKPSDVRQIHQADLLIWVSDDLETFMEESANKAENAQRIIWDQLDGLHLLPTRTGGLWEEHDHNHDEHHGHSHTHHHEHDHHHGEYNSHLWLGTENAPALIDAITNALIELDPENKTRYQENRAQLLQKISALNQELTETLNGLESKPYMVFHDAYPYFEAQFKLNPIGVVRVDPEHEPGVRRIEEIQQTMKENKIICIFNEPQFPSKLVEKLSAGTNVKIGELDPIGADLKASPELFFTLQRNLAENLNNCLR